MAQKQYRVTCCYVWICLFCFFLRFCFVVVVEDEVSELLEQPLAYALQLHARVLQVLRLRCGKSIHLLICVVAVASGIETVEEWSLVG